MTEGVGKGEGVKWKCVKALHHNTITVLHLECKVQIFTSFLTHQFKVFLRLVLLGVKSSVCEHLSQLRISASAIREDFFCQV